MNVFNIFIKVKKKHVFICKLMFVTSMQYNKLRVVMFDVCAAGNVAWCSVTILLVRELAKL